MWRDYAKFIFGHSSTQYLEWRAEFVVMLGVDMPRLMEPYSIETLYIMAKKYVPRKVFMQSDQEDAIQEFVIAAYKAGLRDNGTGIRSLQIIRGNGAITDWLRKKTPGSRVGLPLNLVLVDAVAIAGGGQDEEHNWIVREVQEEPEEDDKRLQKLRAIVNKLSPRDQFILDEHYSGVTAKKIGERLGISESRVHQLLHRSLTHIRYKLGVDKPEEPNYSQLIVKLLQEMGRPVKAKDIKVLLRERCPELSRVPIDTIKTRVRSCLVYLRRHKKIKCLGRHVGWEI